MPIYLEFAKLAPERLKEMIISQWQTFCINSIQIANLIRVLKGEDPEVFIFRQDMSLPPNIAYVRILQAAHELSQKNERLAQETIGQIKISLGPSFTKSTSPDIYARNPYGQCSYYATLWIKSHLTYTPTGEHTKSLKSDFYRAVTKEPMPSHGLTKQEKKQKTSELLLRLEKLNIVPVHANKPNVSEMLDMPVAAFCHILLNEFVLCIKAIVGTMTQQGLNSLAIYIASFDLNHAMAMMIKVHMDYISVVFFDPDAIGGDAKIALSRSSYKDWHTRIQSLLLYSNFDVRFHIPNADLTLICLNTGISKRLLFNNVSYTLVGDDRSPKNLSKFLLNLTREGGDEIYCAEISKLCKIPNIEINLPSKTDGATPLYFASQYGYAEVVHILLTHLQINVNAAKTDDGMTPLYIASDKGHVKIVQSLLARPEINVNAARTDDNAKGATPLYVASQNGYAEIVQMLVRHSKINVNVSRSLNRTPLYIATQCGHIAIVILLMNHNADVYVKIRHMSLLSVALQYKHFAIAELFLTKTNIEVTPEDIQLAIQNGQHELAHRLQQKLII